MRLDVGEICLSDVNMRNSYWHAVTSPLVQPEPAYVNRLFQVKKTVYIPHFVLMKSEMLQLTCM